MEKDAGRNVEKIFKTFSELEKLLYNFVDYEKSILQL